MEESLLDFQTVFPTYTSMYDDNSLRSAEKSGDALLQVVQGIAVLGEDHQLGIRC